MKLIDLHPEWVGSGGTGVIGPDGKPVPRLEKAGIEIDCPCGYGARHVDHERRLFVPFANPIGADATVSHAGWHRTGETFEDLTLSPSIQRRGECNWHGFVRGGEVVDA